MPTYDDVRRICKSLPDVVADETGTAFRVGGKLFAWPWLERVDPKKARIPNLGVLVVRVANEMDKHALIEMDPHVFFTEPHYDNYPAVLIRLHATDEELLAKLLTDAWRIRAPRRLLS
jgi:hypothetical protein